MTPERAAKKFLMHEFPEASTAFFAGSAANGTYTSTSDLDIVVFDNTQPMPFKKKYLKYGWVIEIFLVTGTTYRAFFNEGRRSGLPSLIRMCAEGTIIKDGGIADDIQKEARAVLLQGPHEWSLDEMNQYRVEITECLEDLSGSTNFPENMFIVNRLATLFLQFILRVNEQWIGVGKWAVRSLAAYDKQLCDEYMLVLDSFYKTGAVQGLISFTDLMLEPYGGRLNEGWTEGSLII